MIWTSLYSYWMLEQLGSEKLDSLELGLSDIVGARIAKSLTRTHSSQIRCFSVYSMQNSYMDGSLLQKKF